MLNNMLSTCSCGDASKTTQLLISHPAQDRQRRLTNLLQVGRGRRDLSHDSGLITMRQVEAGLLLHRAGTGRAVNLNYQTHLSFRLFLRCSSFVPVIASSDVMGSDRCVGVADIVLDTKFESLFGFRLSALGFTVYMGIGASLSRRAWLGAEGTARKEKLKFENYANPSIFYSISHIATYNC